MEPDQPQSTPKPSSLRWQILRRALLRRSSNSGKLMYAFIRLKSSIFYTRQNHLLSSWNILDFLFTNKKLTDNPSEKVSLDKVSRRTKSGFNLIPCHVVNDGGEDPESLPRRDVCLYYTLPLPNAPKLCLRWVRDGNSLIIVYLLSPVGRTCSLIAHGWYLVLLKCCFNYSFVEGCVTLATCLCSQRWEDCVDLNDFEVCNQYDIDNTGLVCK